MDGRRSPIYVIGPIIGALLVFFVINSASNRLQADQAALREESAAEAVETAAEGSEAAAEQESTASDAAESESAASEATAETADAAESTASNDEGAAEAPAAEAEQSDAAVAEIAEAHQGLVAPADVVASFNKGGCAGCHVIPGIPGANGQVGPDLSNIGVDGATRVDGVSTDDYIRESILDPNAVIAPECPAGACPSFVMLQTFAETLSEDDLGTIVGYLSTLGTEDAVELAEAPEAAEMEMGLPAESVLEPFAPLPNEPANDAQIALGKYLFFDSRLSGNTSLSCASCHQPENAFTDGEALSRGYPSTNYFRNTPTVMNAAFADYLYWDGRMDAGDLPTTVRDHIAEAHFMSMDGRLMVERINQTPEYVAMFDEAFGNEPGYGRVLNAIAAYVRSLNSPPTAYDEYLAGDSAALSEDAQAGLAIFEANCATCHSGPMLTDEGFYNTGVGTDLSLFDDPERHLTFRRFFRVHGTPDFRNLNEDVGRYAMTLEEGDRGAFNTPSLREVGRTAPYMHDGSLAALENVVNFYNDGGGEGQTAGLEPLGLDETEVAQLVSFLESLSSEPIEVEVPTPPNYGLVALGGQPVEDAAEAEAEEDVADEDATAAEEDADDEAEAAEEADAEPAAEEAAAEAESDATEGAEPVASDEVVAAIMKGTCNACHVIPGVAGAVGVVGPDLTGIGTIAATRVDGQSAEEYLVLSIKDPNSFIAPDCPFGACVPGAMPATLATSLAPEEIDLIVQYLLELHGGGE